MASESETNDEHEGCQDCEDFRHRSTSISEFSDRTASFVILYYVKYSFTLGAPMAPDRMATELGLTFAEQSTVENVFRTGRGHPWSDRLVDEAIDLIDLVAFDYLRTKRELGAIVHFVPMIRSLLDKVLLERLDSARSADRDVRENPPYHTADRWPRRELPVVEKVMTWAFEAQLPQP